MLILDGATHATLGGGNRGGKRGGGEPKDSSAAKTYLRGGEFQTQLAGEDRFEIK